LVRDAPDRGEPKIDRGRRIFALFEVNPVPEHDGAVEREAGLRTVPGDELANRVIVGSLAARRRQAVQDGRLGVFEIRGRQNPLGRPLLARFRLGHRQRPPSPLPTDSSTGSSCGVCRDRPDPSLSTQRLSPFTYSRIALKQSLPGPPENAAIRPLTMAFEAARPFLANASAASVVGNCSPYTVVRSDTSCSR